MSIMSSLGPSLQELAWGIVADSVKSYAAPLLSDFVSQRVRPLWHRYWPVTYGDSSAPESPSGGTSTSVEDGGDDNDIIYVAVGNTRSSKDALQWMLNHAINNASSRRICLIHVYPKTRYIRTPLGSKMPASQVNERYNIQDIRERTVFLQEFLDACSPSEIVDSVLIESDRVAEALLDHIRSHNVTKLVLGTTKSSPSELSKVAGQVLEKAPELCCEVKLICEGMEVEIGSLSEPPSSRGHSGCPTPNAARAERNSRKRSFGFTCFKLRKRRTDANSTGDHSVGRASG